MYPGKILYGSLPAGLVPCMFVPWLSKKVQPREISLATKLFLLWVPVSLSFLDLAFFFPFTHVEIMSSYDVGLHACMLT